MHFPEMHEFFSFSTNYFLPAPRQITMGAREGNMSREAGKAVSFFHQERGGPLKWRREPNSCPAQMRGAACFLPQNYAHALTGA